MPGSSRASATTPTSVWPYIATTRHRDTPSTTLDSSSKATVPPDCGHRSNRQGSPRAIRKPRPNRGKPGVNEEFAKRDGGWRHIRASLDLTEQADASLFSLSPCVESAVPLLDSTTRCWVPFVFDHDVPPAALATDVPLHITSEASGACSPTTFCMRRSHVASGRLLAASMNSSIVTDFFSRTDSGV